MQPYQRVRLLTDKYLEDGIKKGDIGCIVEKWDESHFEVDFSDENGFTIVCFAFPKDELEPVLELKVDYINAHLECKNHKSQILNDEKCGCFYCCKVFSPQEIDFWLEEGDGTAVCPYCRIDSVIGESSGFPITEEFLKKMNEYWF